MRLYGTGDGDRLTDWEAFYAWLFIAVGCFCMWANEYLAELAGGQ